MNPSTIARVNGNRYFCVIGHDILSPVGYHHYYSPYYFSTPSEPLDNVFSSVQEIMDTVLKSELPPRTTEITIYKVVTRFEGDVAIEDYEAVLVCEGGFCGK